MKKFVFVAIAAMSCVSLAKTPADPPKYRVYNLTTTTKRLENQLVKKSKTFKNDPYQTQSQAFQCNELGKAGGTLNPEYAPAEDMEIKVSGKNVTVSWYQYATKKSGDNVVKLTKWVTEKQDYFIVLGDGKGTSYKDIKQESGKAQAYAWKKTGNKKDPYHYWEEPATLAVDFREDGNGSIAMTLANSQKLVGSAKLAKTSSDKNALPDYITSASGDLVDENSKVFGTWKLSYDKKTTDKATAEKSTFYYLSIYDLKGIDPKSYGK